MSGRRNNIDETEFNYETDANRKVRKRSLSSPPPLSPAKKTARSTDVSTLENDRTYCRTCKRRFSKPSALNRHLQQAHGTGRWLKCQFEGCGELCARQDTLQRHIATQHGEAKTRCTKCRELIRKDGLTAHMSTKVCSIKAAALLAVASAAHGPSPPFGTYPISTSRNLPTDSTVFASLSSTWSYRIAPTSLASNCGQNMAAFSRDKDTTRGHSVVRAASPFIPAVYRFQPTVVPNTPGPTTHGTMFDPMLTDSEEDLTHLVAQAHSLQGDTTLDVACETSVRLSVDEEMRHMCDRKIQRLYTHKDRPFGLFLEYGARRTRRRLYGMQFGATCGLCQDKLGDTPEEVLQHAKRHIHNHNAAAYRCSKCEVEFRYKRDLHYHNKFLDDANASITCQQLAIYGDGDWVGRKSQIDHQRFVDGLRKWENMQLRWFLMSVQEFLFKSGRTKYRNTVTIGSHVTHGAISNLESSRKEANISPATVIVSRSEVQSRSCESVDMKMLMSKFEHASLNDITTEHFTSGETNSNAKTVRLATGDRPRRREYCTLASLSEQAYANLYASCRNGDLFGACKHMATLEHEDQIASLDRAVKIALDAGHDLVVRKFLDTAKKQLQENHDACYKRSGMTWACCEQHWYASEWYKALLDLILGFSAHTISLILNLRCTETIKANLHGMSTDSPLIYCIKNRFFEALAFLLDAGVPPDWNRNSEGRTALHFAAIQGQYRVVCRLLVSGARVDSEDHSGQTALMHAYRSGHAAIIRYLTSRMQVSPDITGVIHKALESSG